MFPIRKTDMKTRIVFPKMWFDEKFARVHIQQGRGSQERAAARVARERERESSSGEGPGMMRE